MDDVYKYYETICIETNEPILLSYSSRKSIFKDKVLVLIGGVYYFHALSKGNEIIIIPKEFVIIPIDIMLSQVNNDFIEGKTLPLFEGLALHKPNDNIFIAMIHIALKLHGDILSHPSFTGFGVSQQSASSSTSISLLLFLEIHYGRDVVLDGDIGIGVVAEEIFD